MRRHETAIVVGVLLVASVAWLVLSGPGGTRSILCAERADFGAGGGDDLASGTDPANGTGSTNATVPENVTVLAAAEEPVADAPAVRSLVRAAAERDDLECEPFSRTDFAGLRQRFGDDAYADPEDRAPRGFYVRYEGTIYRVYSSALV